MKLPFQKPPIMQEYLLSLVLDLDYVSAAVWHIVARTGQSIIDASASVIVTKDDWNERVIASDRVISKLEELVGTNGQITKVTLGLPAGYLTETGDIKKTIASQIKKLTHELELTPVGFVSLYQAIIHKLKKEEGVPPSIILLGVSGVNIHISIYRTGTLVSQGVIHLDNIIRELEDFFTAQAAIDILPARMVVYGGRVDVLEHLKRELLKISWQSKAQFLHFPKIVVLPVDTQVLAVSLAGANELSNEVVEEDEEDVVEATEVMTHKKKKEEEEDSTTETIEDVIEEHKDAQLDGQRESDDTIEDEEEPEEAKQTDEEHNNVVVVKPETLGFAAHTSHKEEPETHEKKVEMEYAVPVHTVRHTHADPIPESEEAQVFEKKISKGPKLPIPKIRIPSFSRFSKSGSIIAIIGVILLIVIGSVWHSFTQVFPKAVISVKIIPKTITKSSSIPVTFADASIPATSSAIQIVAKKIEKSVSGEGATPATGKKKVGDPAKGTVTIFNKATQGRSLKKGTILTANSVQFTLDSDISVASASENLVSGTVTFGKQSASITAVNIGEEGNVVSATEFTFKDYSVSSLIARNDTAFSGGTSRSITVISRADQDTLVKQLSAELVEKAKTELSASVSGNEKLLDNTVKTTVTEKKFNQEINEEAKELKGSITIAVTGYTYSEDDLFTLLPQIVGDEMTQGYVLQKDKSTVTVDSVTTKKEKTTLAATYAVTIVPSVDSETVKKQLAGKTIKEATDFVKTITGIDSLTASVQWSLTPGRLPKNPSALSVTFVTE